MTRVYGLSDDLIEIDGDIVGEFGAYNNRAGQPNGTVIFDDGTIAEWRYDHNGIWRCTVLKKGKKFDHLDVCDGSDVDEDYTDILHLKDGVKRAWVTTGTLERVS